MDLVKAIFYATPRHPQCVADIDMDGEVNHYNLYYAGNGVDGSGRFFVAFKLRQSPPRDRYVLDARNVSSDDQLIWASRTLNRTAHPLTRTRLSKWNANIRLYADSYVENQFQIAVFDSIYYHSLRTLSSCNCKTSTRSQNKPLWQCNW